MKKGLHLSFFIIFLSFLPFLYAQNTPQQQDINKILISTESVFKTMESKDFKGIWQGITEKSKKRIVEDVYKEEQKLSKKENKPMVLTKEMIFDDFNSVGPISKAYWNAFLEVFDPVTVLEQSTWKMGKIEGNYAEVIIQYRKSERPAIVQMYNEKGEWKLGLVETFWTSIR